MAECVEHPADEQGFFPTFRRAPFSPSRTGRPPRSALRLAGGAVVLLVAGLLNATVIAREADLAALVKARHSQPHAVLGMHQTEWQGRKGVVVRAFLKNVRSCEVVDYLAQPERRYRLTRLDPAGFFEGFIPDHPEIFAYRLRIERNNGEIRQFYDPYCFLPSLSEDDLYLINQGNDHRVYAKLGSHLRDYGGVHGVSFAVWAPGAKRVSVVGDFNQWDGRYHPMRSLGASGIWEIFIPGLEAGAKYKYEIISGADYLLLKTDPYALYYEPPPHNAAIVWDVADFKWHDAEWLEQRAANDWQARPISVYEVHLGSWKRVVEDNFRSLTYLEAAQDLALYVKKMGFTHVEFMPLAEHPFTGSWGYQVTGFYAPTHRYGTPQEFMKLVDVFHQHGLGVIMDWVPAHFPRDAFALAEFDGTHLYEHADPRQGFHHDWGTLIFNYGRHEVRGFLIGSALAWFDRYHIDGLRVDAVASMLYLDYSRPSNEWIPNRYGGRENLEAIAFLRQTNDLVHHYYPGALTIAEESTAFGGVSSPVAAGGLGFDFKWNMGWMHDTLEYLKEDPLNRKWHHDQLTFPMLFQFTEKFISVFSHDEVVHGKGSLIMKMGSWTMADKARTLRALYAMMWLWPGKKSLFMGQEWGQSSEWNFDGSLEWHLLQYPDHEGTRLVVRDLNQLYLGEPGLAALDQDPAGFQWINCHDGENSVISFLRIGPEGEQIFAVVCNFTPVTRAGYRVGLPKPGGWKEILNTDAACYGGHGEGNCGGFTAQTVPWDDREFSAPLLVPGLATLIFKWDNPTARNSSKKKRSARRPAAPPPLAPPAETPAPAPSAPAEAPAADASDSTS
jgi:1,4-alpha-glucan branching enzyme